MKYIDIVKRDGPIVLFKKILFKILVKTKINKLINIKRYGFKIKLFNSDLTYQIFADKNYKIYEDKIYKKYLNKNSAAIDVGANIGLVTLTMAKICKDGKVLSFEPSKKFYNITNSNIELNNLKNVKTYPYALGEKSGSIGFDETEKDDTTFKINNSISNNFVEIRTLDEFTQQFSKVDFLKIDVEGYEVEVLMGAKETLKKTDIVFIEFITNNQTNTSHNQVDIINILKDHFDIFTLDQNLNEIKFEFEENKSYKTDLLCLSKKISKI